MTRRQARQLALQILFANEFLNENYREVANRVLQSLGEEADEFTPCLTGYYYGWPWQKC